MDFQLIQRPKTTICFSKIIFGRKILNLKEMKMLYAYKFRMKKMRLKQKKISLQI